MPTTLADSANIVKPAATDSTLLSGVREPEPPDPFMIDGKFAQSDRDDLKVSHDKCNLELIRSLNTKFDNNNIIVSYDCPSHVTVDGVTRPAINMSLVEGLGKLMLAET